MSILICFFLALVPYATSITFNFTHITPKDSSDIIVEGDAVYAPQDGIQVTHQRDRDRGSFWLAGRARYMRPLHLWDNDSTDLASFSTTFSFVIDSNMNFSYG
ncbi:putative legume lectin domain, concanavalin A-like lectin/glucanase domain superfamily [Helianthus anomalus]